MTEKILYYKNAFLSFYQRHELMVSASVFLLGFVFDLLTLGRIDDLLNLVQQAVYLAILGTILTSEIRLKMGLVTLSDKGKKFWDYHDLIVHFLFGSLLSVYTIFYFTSASAIASFFFLLLLIGLMLANEFPQFQKIGLPVRVILYSICLLSYFSFFYPILIGHVGQIPFWLGFLTSIGFFFLIWKFPLKKIALTGPIKNLVLIPALVIHLLFLVGYYASFIPPVPVAIKKIGVYYQVTKANGEYLGNHQRPYWKFWEKGSQNFSARAGDKIHVLMAIFSPARFNDQVNLKWYFDDPKLGWSLQDSIPLTILGGREAGFRGYGVKSNYQIGDWRVVVETSDGREVGRIGFSVSSDQSHSERVFEQDQF